MANLSEKEKLSLFKEGYTADQIEEISLGKEAELDVSLYMDKEFLAIQMRQIRLGLKAGIEAKLYANQEYDWFQMEELRLGMQDGVDVKSFLNSDIPYMKMRQTRKALLEGVDITPYLDYPDLVVRQLRKAVISHVDLLPFAQEGYGAEQLEQIRLCLEHGVDIAPYLSSVYIGPTLEEIRLGLEEGLDVSQYAREELNWQQMREIRLGLHNRVDISQYNDVLYTRGQMREVRLGLEQGLDVSYYNCLMYPAAEMIIRRKRLLDSENGIVVEVEEKEVNLDFCMIATQSDGMEALLTVMDDPGPITAENIHNILTEHGITAGFIEENIEKIVKKEYGSKPILVAKGKLPHKGEDGYYEFLFNTKSDNIPEASDDGSVDYKNIRAYESVKAGQKVAEYHPAKEGDEGYNVMGAPIPARKGIEQEHLTGKGFHIDEDQISYIADVDGLITLKGNQMEITEKLTLEEVNIATGNVYFKGNVDIRGRVGDGVIIQATEDIVIDGFVGAASLIAGGSIMLRGGMNGAGKGTVCAGKNVTSGFFEQVAVEAGEDITTNISMNSLLRAKGKITVNSTALAGTLVAERGVRIRTLGNKMGVKTLVQLGADEASIKRKNQIEHEIKAVYKELSIFQNHHKEIVDNFPPEIRNEMDLFLKLENAIYTKNLQMSKLKKEKSELELYLLKTEGARVEITGDAYEGSVVELNGHRWYAENQRNIVLKKKNGVLDVAVR